MSQKYLLSWQLVLSQGFGLNDITPFWNKKPDDDLPYSLTWFKEEFGSSSLVLDTHFTLSFYVTLPPDINYKGYDNDIDVMLDLPVVTTRGEARELVRRVKG